MKHLNTVIKDMNINASEEELKLVLCPFFYSTEDDASKHNYKRPEDESHLFEHTTVKSLKHLIIVTRRIVVRS